MSHNYERGKVDKTFFIKKSKFAIILVQIYVNDIIFSATNDGLCEEFMAAINAGGVWNVYDERIILLLRVADLAIKGCYLP